MIRVKRCINDKNRLVLQVGKNEWHISYQEARNIQKDLKNLKVNRRKK